MASRKKRSGSDSLFTAPNDSKLQKAEERMREYQARAEAERKRLDAEVAASIDEIPATLGKLLLASLYSGDWRRIDLASLTALLKSADVEQLPVTGSEVSGKGNAFFFRRLCDSAQPEPAKPAEEGKAAEHGEQAEAADGDGRLPEVPDMPVLADGHEAEQPSAASIESAAFIEQLEGRVPSDASHHPSLEQGARE